MTDDECHDRRTYNHDGEVEAAFDSFAMNLLRQVGEPKTLIIVLLFSIHTQAGAHTHMQRDYRVGWLDDLVLTVFTVGKLYTCLT